MSVFRAGLALAGTALLAAASPALAHQGSPDYLSQVRSIAPALQGLSVERPQPRRPARDPQHERAHGGRRGLQQRPVRAAARRRRGRGQHPLARLLPQQRPLREGQVPASAKDERGAALEAGVEDRPLRVARPPHALHGQGPPGEDRGPVGAPDGVRLEGAAGGRRRPGSINGRLLWTPREEPGLPLGAIFAFAALAIAGCIAVFVVRRRRAGAAPAEPKEAW